MRPRRARASSPASSRSGPTLTAAAFAGAENLAIDAKVVRSLTRNPERLSVDRIRDAAVLSLHGDLQRLLGTVVARPPGRRRLDADNVIDWDDDPTIYQAVTIAHGHLLRFKQEWVADGYSMGNLLYSLPLAPGQKKQIAVVDWERKETTTRDEFRESRDSLEAMVDRDRDISEIVSGTLAGVQPRRLQLLLRRVRRRARDRRDHPARRRAAGRGWRLLQRRQQRVAELLAADLRQRAQPAARPYGAERVVGPQPADLGGEHGLPGRAGHGDDGVGGQLQPLPRDHDPVLRGAAAPAGAAAGRRRPGVPVRADADVVVHQRQGAALAQRADPRHAAAAAGRVRRPGRIAASYVGSDLPVGRVRRREPRGGRGRLRCASSWPGRATRTTTSTPAPGRRW